MRQITRQRGILLIYDEVISFRVSYGGAQGRYGGDPDLTAFGKIIGGGFPVGATGGRAEVMEVFDPGTRGPRIASGGTFSANPVSMTGGLATMRAMTPEAFDRLETLGARFRTRVNEVFRAAGVPGQATVFRHRGAYFVQKPVAVCLAHIDVLQVLANEQRIQGAIPLCRDARAIDRRRR